MVGRSILAAPTAHVARAPPPAAFAVAVALVVSLALAVAPATQARSIDFWIWPLLFGGAAFQRCEKTGLSPEIPEFELSLHPP